MLTTKEIEDIEFKATRIKEGYDQEEVDDFLDRVAVDYANLQAKVSTLQEQLRRLTDAPTAKMNPVTPLETADRLLRVAERTAQQHIADAELKADEIVREAGGKAAQQIEAADRAAETMKEKARVEAAGILGQAQAEAAKTRVQRDQLSEQITQLEDKRRTYKSWLESTLEHLEKEEVR